MATSDSSCDDTDTIDNICNSNEMNNTDSISFGTHKDMNNDIYSKSIMDVPTPSINLQIPSKQGRSERFLMPLINGCLNVKFHGIEIPALVDSGATLSFISKRFFSKLLYQGSVKKLYHTRNKVILADNKAYSIRIVASVALSINGRQFTFTFSVLPQLHRPVILGVNFLKHTGASISYAHVPRSEYLIRNPSKLVLSPNSETTCLAYIYTNENLSSTIGTTENYNYNPFCMVQHTLVNPSKITNAIPIRLLNPFDRTIKVPKKAILGLYSITTEKDFISPDLNQTQHKDPLFGKPTPINCPRDPLHSVPSSNGPLKYKLSDRLTPTQRKELKTIVEENREAFVTSDTVIGTCKTQPVKIQLKDDAVPVNKPQYRTTPQKQKIMQQLLEKQAQQGVIVETEDHSPWNAPVFLVQKPHSHNKTGVDKYRIVVDMRGLNEQIVTTSYPFPRADDIIETIGNSQSKWFSKLDIYSAYHQVPLDPSTAHVTSFSSFGKRYRYTKLPMGLTLSAKYFQHCIEQLLQKCKFRCAAAYVDDITVYSKSWNQHLVDLDEVLKLFVKGNIKLKSEKCEFGAQEIDFLGYRISHSGLSPSPEKVNLIKNYPIPQTVSQVRSFNGLANFYKKFIKNFSIIMQPLYELTKHNKKFEWTAVCQTSFDTIIKAICEDAVLRFPDYDRPFTIFTDASATGLGCTITQTDEHGFYRPIEFAGRNLSDTERRYHTTDRECLGVIYAIKKFRHYLEDAHFTIYTDHAALVTLFTRKEASLNMRRARWLDTIMSYDMTLKFLPGKINVPADICSRLSHPPHSEDPLPEMPSGNVSYPTPKVRFSDFTIIKTFRDSDRIPKSPILLTKPLSIVRKRKPSPKTNPPRATSSCQAGMTYPSYASDNSFETLAVVTRSQTKRAQATPAPIQDKPTAPTAQADKRKTNRKRSRPAASRARAEHRRNRATKVALPMATDFMSDLGRYFHVPPSHDGMHKAQSNDSFCSAMKSYLLHNNLPKDTKLARQVLLIHDQFILVDEILYRYTDFFHHTKPPCLQLVVPEKYTRAVIEHFHSSPLGGHLGPNRTYPAISKSFYWPTAFSDTRDFILTCQTCITTKRAPRKLKPPLTLRDPTPCTFTHVSIDHIGPLHQSSSGHKYICAVICYASRYVIAWPCKDISAASTVENFFSKICCIYGIPHTLYCDNGATFTSTLFGNFCKHLGIKLVFSSAYHSRTQGLIEKTNNTIQTGLRSFVDACQDEWPRFLSAVVFAINNTVSASLGYSPNMLVYGKDSPLPMDLLSKNILEIPQYSNVRQMFRTLNDRRTNSLLHSTKLLATSHAKMKARYDKTAHHHNYKEGDIAFLQIPFLLRKNSSKKLQKYFSGPYIITKFTSPVTCHLRRLRDGKNTTKPVHVERLRVPKPRNKKFLQRLEMSALPKLMDPDKIAAAPLSAADRVNLHV